MNKYFVKRFFNINLTMLILPIIVFFSMSLANPILFNISNISLKRAVPPNQGCHNDVWAGRFCNGNEGAGAYRDECEVHGDAGVQVYYANFECAANEACFEYLDADGDAQIDCINVPRTPNKDDTISKRKQYGKRKFGTQGTQGAERKVSVKVQNDMGPSSSVSAHVMG